MADLVVVGVKVPPEVKERWLASAERGGVSLSVWVRGACEERVRAGSFTELLPEVVAVTRDTITVRAVERSPITDSVGTPFHVKMRDEAPRTFREGCSGSHVAGVVCSVCGGRMW